MGRQRRGGYGPKGQREAFIESDGQLRLTDKSGEQELLEEEPVECLGVTFESDEARRAHFLERLQDKLPELRNRPDFPLGPDGGPAADADVLRLSDPPFFTACPNPFWDDAISAFRKRFPGAPSVADRFPFAADVTEGKGEHFYNVHTYHTKVPYRPIARFLLHYTSPGDVVLDPFCGTGMLALAAQACVSKRFVQDLDPEVSPEAIGPRLALASDLSPAATHIAANYNAHVDSRLFVNECDRILTEFQSALGWMFTTRDPDTGKKAPVDYYVWSDVFACPECAHEILFWKQGIDQETGYKKSGKEIQCPSCSAVTDRDAYERVLETYYDDLLGETCRKQKERLVLVAYSIGRSRREKEPDDYDLDLVQRIAREPIENLVPVLRMLHRDGGWGDLHRSGYHVGMTHFHHFYYRRSLRAVAWLWARVEGAPIDLRPRLRWWLQSVSMGHTRLNRYFTSSYSQVNRYLKGFLYIAQVRSEVAPWYSLRGKIKRMAAAPPGRGDVSIATASATCLPVGEECIDYIFTDPPFGGNIMYSELNFMWEAWLNVITAQDAEAIVNKTQGKALADYEQLMQASFSECHRVLKPGRWITVLFHNSQNAVWIAIQNALERAGFVVADVRVFDKKQLTMKQQTAAGTVQKDLIITAYKPNGGLEERFELEAGSEDGVWDFARAHLRKLPVFVAKDGQAEAIVERQSHLLFDRMVAFHVQRGVTVSLSAARFYEGLAQRFAERDGMYFLPEQAPEYDRKRASVSDVAQVELFVKDEESAIQWLKQQLSKKPQTFQELQPQFMKELSGWERHEEQLELSDLLEENFLRYDGKGEVPSQIHSYLSSNFKDLRGLEKDDPALQAKAKDRWYAPDPRKAGDLEKLRERSLLKEFEEYRTAKKKLKVFRLEAVRAGFKRAWQDRDYATIIAVAEKIPERVLQEDPKLLMWYDQAVTRSGEG